MPEISFRVNAVTVGSTGCKFGHLSGGYVYGGNKPLGSDPDIKTMGGAERTYGRDARVSRLGDALAGMGRDPQDDIPPADLIKAGVAVGVGAKTARSYLAQLRNQLRNQRQENAS